MNATSFADIELIINSLIIVKNKKRHSHLIVICYNHLIVINKV